MLGGIHIGVPAGMDAQILPSIVLNGLTKIFLRGGLQLKRLFSLHDNTGLYYSCTYSLLRADLLSEFPLSGSSFFRIFAFPPTHYC